MVEWLHGVYSHVGQYADNNVGVDQSTGPHKSDMNAL